ncbi:phospholipase A1 PLIP2, chloroplastic-like [Vicia villosa]|uniref:phospholipase A1 PLIP2, chloroplastic-like n=1 Tax=Vicia villosa TaxID=3911 RepID=UPI00273CEB65|nr:phospholipase A1 PLIP2, chloroplastic-like [Vicia villosa]
MDTFLQTGFLRIVPFITAFTANNHASQSHVLSRFSFGFRKSPNSRVIGDAVMAKNMVVAETEGEGKNANWIFKVFDLNSVWRGGRESGDDDDDDDDEECDVCSVGEDEDEEEVWFDRESFSRMLRRVTLVEARMYAHLCHLGNFAYSIPNIKSGNLLKRCGLRFVTSSIEKREMAATAEKNLAFAAIQKQTSEKDAGEKNEENNDESMINASTACEISAVEGSLEASSGSVDTVDVLNTDAGLMATTDSMTAVVVADEDVKQAFADDVNSTSSTPCEWYICDDDQSSTRYFVIQGSESFESWQANLLFEPVQFEGFDVLVHRGIYEAAKVTYQQMLPEVHAHLNSKGSRATFRFTGHSLGGSLALLVNLMLLIRKEVPISSLLPVVTFGSPFIMCGGDHLLEKLGFPRSHVQAIAMHRDIVPRAFSCKYPNHVTELLKAVNASFRCHPCLNNQKLLYAPIGELVILQPDDNVSPSHDLLPSGSGLYLLSGPLSESSDTENQIRAAQLFFLNSPHPLEILSDRSAYGSGGTIQRDHDMSSYLKSIRTVIRQELSQIRTATRRELSRKVRWPLVARRVSDADIVGGRSIARVRIIQDQPPFSGIIQKRRESLKRFSRLVASQHMQIFVMFLFPARLLLLETCNLTNLS